MTDEDSRQVEMSISGLRKSLAAITDKDGTVLPEIAEMLGVSVEWLSKTASDMRWLLAALKRMAGEK